MLGEVVEKTGWSCWKKKHMIQGTFLSTNRRAECTVHNQKCKLKTMCSPAVFQDESARETHALWVNLCETIMIFYGIQQSLRPHYHIRQPCNLQLFESPTRVRYSRYVPISAPRQAYNNCTYVANAETILSNCE